MKSAQEITRELGIEAKHYHQGSQTAICPKCSHTRKKKRAQCLKVTIDNEGVRWWCHHCNWNGGIYYDGKVELKNPPRRKVLSMMDMRSVRNGV